IPRTLPARRLVSVNSLYVLPPHRRRGTASRILEALDDAARRQGILGIRIDADWRWRRSIRFYLARSMWVWSWKREIGLGFDSALPPYRIDVDGEVAEFSIGRDDARQALWRARRAGTRLDLEETTALRRLETNDDGPAHRALQPRHPVRRARRPRLAADPLRRGLGRAPEELGRRSARGARRQDR